MPLPGAYPIDGNLGRLLASLEDSALLLLAAAACLGVLRGPVDPPRALLLVFFALMAAGSALIEPDLGSAARHRLMYLPMLFPFAAAAFFRRSS